MDLMTPITDQALLELLSMCTHGLIKFFESIARLGEPPKDSDGFFLAWSRFLQAHGRIAENQTRTSVWEANKDT